VEDARAGKEKKFVTSYKASDLGTNGLKLPQEKGMASCAWWGPRYTKKEKGGAPGGGIQGGFSSSKTGGGTRDEKTSKAWV